MSGGEGGSQFFDQRVTDIFRTSGAGGTFFVCDDEPQFLIETRRLKGVGRQSDLRKFPF